MMRIVLREEHLLVERRETGRDLERGQVVDVDFGNVEKPINDLTRLAKSKLVLKIIELNCSWN